MAFNTLIEWCKHTLNLWWGCVEVHAGCDNCYARELSNRYGGPTLWGNSTPRRVIKSAFDDLDKYQKLAARAGEIHSVFIGSMMDIFEKPMPLINHKGEAYPPEFTTGTLRDILFLRISEGWYPNLLFYLLTKRPSNINKYIPPEWLNGAPLNVMFGTSPVDQETADKLIPQLAEVKGRRFLSIEPQLGAIDMFKEYTAYEPDYDAPASWRLIDGIHWGINGGESGNNRRPFDLAWGRSLRDQFKEAGVPFFFKQINKIDPIPEDLLIREFPV